MHVMDAMTQPQSLAALRANGWSGVPSTPGVYWWYFPQTELRHLRVAEFCDVSKLQLRSAPDGKVCLYHGMANSLALQSSWRGGVGPHERTRDRQAVELAGTKLARVTGT